MPKSVKNGVNMRGLVTLRELAERLEIHGGSGALAPKLIKAQRIIEHAGIPVLAMDGRAQVEGLDGAFVAPDEWAVGLSHAEGIWRSAADEKALTDRLAEEQARKIESGRYTLLEAVAVYFGRPRSELVDLLEGPRAGRNAPPMTYQEKALLEKLSKALVPKDKDSPPELRAYMPGFRIPHDYQPGEMVREEHDEVEWQDFSAWLEAKDFPPVTPAPVSAASAPGSSEELDWKLLANRDQLVSAFRFATGMCMEWFDNITDKPALLKARKVQGIGQKNARREPLFCPYEVLIWLVSKKRRVGLPISTERGWALYEQHFPRSYALHSIGDPRNG